MSNNQNHLSPYRIMWLFVMFDLPVGTKKERDQATKFRQGLLDLGFEMSQFSVYLKYCPSKEKSEVVSDKVKVKIPIGGKVDILMITDKQFAGMKRFYAKTEIKSNAKPKQLHIF